MISLIKKIKSHNVSRNALALIAIQFTNYLVPLLVLPLLAKRLGMQSFGAVAMTFSAIQLAFIITDYGFSLSATYEISKNRTDTNYINKKISSIFGAKIILLIPTVTIILATPHIIPELLPYRSLVTASLIAIIAQAFLPTWLFQGIERMKNITIYTVMTKVAYAGLIYAAVRTPKDADLVIYMWGVANTLGLAASIFFLYNEGFKLASTSFNSVFSELKEGLEYFWSRVAVSLYTSASTLVVGTQGSHQAALFSVCDQLYKAGKSVTTPITNALFPYMANEKNWGLFYKFLFITGSTISTGCLIISFFSRDLIEIIFGKEFVSADSTLLVFLAATVVNYLSVTFGYSAFAALNRIRFANISVMIGALTHIIILLYLYQTEQLSSINVAFSILITESLVFLIRITSFSILKARTPR